MVTRLLQISATNSSDAWTFRDIWTGAHSTATFLRLCGFSHKDVAFSVIPNCPQQVIFFLGASLLGGTISGIGAFATDFEIEYQLRDAAARVVLTDNERLSKVLVAAKKSSSVKVGFLDLSLGINRQTILVVGSSEEEANLPWGVTPFRSALQMCPAFGAAKVFIDPVDDVCFLPYSSGTTGRPKGVMLSHKNMVTTLNMYKWHFEERIFKVIDPSYKYEEDSWLLFLPWYHIFGFSLVMTSLLCGIQGIFFRQFQPETFLAAIQNYKIRFIALVPPILVHLAKNPICEKFDLSSLQMILTASAPAGADLINEVLKKYPNIKMLRQGYGMSEVSTTHLPDAATPWNLNASGRLMSNLEHKIINERGEEVPDGERGELCIRGPLVMLGYLHRPDATKDTIDDDGDIGRIDARGDLFIVDRLKELIKVKGLQVAPAELEDVLLSHPQIRDAAVIGVPDADAGELPYAFIVRADHDLFEGEVAEYVKARVSSYKYLRGGIRFVSEIPKSISGKILRRQLRETYASTVAKAKL